MYNMCVSLFKEFGAQNGAFCTNKVAMATDITGNMEVTDTRYRGQHYLVSENEYNVKYIVTPHTIKGYLI